MSRTPKPYEFRAEHAARDSSEGKDSPAFIDALFRRAVLDVVAATRGEQIPKQEVAQFNTEFARFAEAAQARSLFSTLRPGSGVVEWLNAGQTYGNTRQMLAMAHGQLIIHPLPSRFTNKSLANHSVTLQAEVAEDFREEIAVMLRQMVPQFFHGLAPDNAAVEAAAVLSVQALEEAANRTRQSIVDTIVHEHKQGRLNTTESQRSR